MNRTTIVSVACAAAGCRAGYRRRTAARHDAARHFSAGEPGDPKKPARDREGHDAREATAR